MMMMMIMIHTKDNFEYSWHIRNTILFHFFRCCSYIAELERQQSNSGTLDPSHHPSRNNSEHISPLSDSSSSLSGYLNGDVSPNGDSNRISDQSSTNGGILSSGDVSRAIFALSAAVDRLFEHAANTLNIGSLLSFMQVWIWISFMVDIWSDGRSKEVGGRLKLLDSERGTWLQVGQWGRWSDEGRGQLKAGRWKRWSLERG